MRESNGFVNPKKKKKKSLVIFWTGQESLGCRVLCGGGREKKKAD